MKEKVVLAYSGGLDTTVILKWLQVEKKLDVIAFIADLGQENELEEAKNKAIAMGAKDVVVEDLKEQFVKDFVFPMFRCNTIYEGEYLLGTAIARPLIVLRQMEIAKEKGARMVSHGATGKGNDQIRFELGYYSIDPEIKVIAPWREWNLNSRTKLLSYAKENGVQVSTDKLGEPPYSMDANLLHISYEGRVLEDPWKEPDESMYRLTKNPLLASNEGQVITVFFERGDPIAIDGKSFSPANLLKKLNEIGSENGIGRIDIVENRFIGMKSRGIYETPGGTILFVAHRAIESITLDGPSMHLKDEIMPKYAEMIYNGLWFSPERKMLQALIDKSQENVSGQVRLRLRKGVIQVLGRLSDRSLYSKDISTFEEDKVYDQKDAEGFIKLNALRLKLRKDS